MFYRVRNNYYIYYIETNKINKKMKNLIKLFVIAVMTISLFACEKEETPSYPDGTYFYMPVPSSNLKSTYAVNEVEPIFFNPIPEKFYDNLVVNYHLDGDATDAGLNGLDGVVITSELTEGTFNSTSDSTCIVVEDNPNFTFRNLTVAIWYNYNSTVKVDEWQGLIGQPNTDTNRTESSGAFSLGIINPTYDYPEDFWPAIMFNVNSATGNEDVQCLNNVAVQNGINLLEGWHFVAGVYDLDNDFIGIYVDGILMFSYEIQNEGLADSDAPLYIGRMSNLTYKGYPGYFYGAVDEAMLFNKALTQEEITEIYNLRIVQ